MGMREGWPTHVAGTGKGSDTFCRATLLFAFRVPFPNTVVAAQSLSHVVGVVIRMMPIASPEKVSLSQQPFMLTTSGLTNPAVHSHLSYPAAGHVWRL